MQIKLLGDRILVALPPKAETQDPVTGFTVQDLKETDSGLLLAKPTDVYNVETASRGIVVQLGEKRGQVDVDDVRAELNEFFIANPDNVYGIRDWLDRLVAGMAPAPFDVAVGECILFSPASGEPVFDEDSDIEYVILRESDIIGVIEPTKEQVA